MKRVIASVVAVVAVWAGCPGGDDRSSGVDADRLVIEMSADELDTFCAYVAEITAHQQDTVCDGMTVKGTMTKEQCIDGAPTATDNPSCTVTVGQMEACFEAAAETEDPCNPTSAAKAACQGVFNSDCV